MWPGNVKAHLRRPIQVWELIAEPDTSDSRAWHVLSSCLLLSNLLKNMWNWIPTFVDTELLQPSTSSHLFSLHVNLVWIPQWDSLYDCLPLAPSGQRADIPSLLPFSLLNKLFQSVSLLPWQPVEWRGLQNKGPEKHDVLKNRNLLPKWTQEKILFVVKYAL